MGSTIAAFVQGTAVGAMIRGIPQTSACNGDNHLFGGRIVGPMPQDVATHRNLS